MKNETTKKILVGIVTVIIIVIAITVVINIPKEKLENESNKDKEIVSKTLVSKLLSKSNSASIQDYNSGNKREMYTFNHPTTSQTPALTDYRYIGDTPNNYIRFNNEIWRIIGVFTVVGENGTEEQRVKIIRDKSIGNLGWDSKTNEWPSSTLSTMLNGDYLNIDGIFTYTWYNYEIRKATIVQGLNAITKSKIAPTKWYLGHSDTVFDLIGSEYYYFERGDRTTPENSKNIVANVGLMYPSDYIFTYAYGVDNSCFNNGNQCSKSYGGNPSTGWLFNSENQWTITPDIDERSVLYISPDGVVLEVYDTHEVDSDLGVRPCVYLRSDIETTDGDGTQENPYIIGS